MKYRVELKHWIDGSGFSHSEIFDNLSEYMSAADYINRLDKEIIVEPGHDIQVEIYKEDNIISSAFVREILDKEV